MQWRFTYISFVFVAEALICIYLTFTSIVSHLLFPPTITLCSILDMTDQQRDVIDAESQPNQHLDGLMKENSNVKVQPRLASHLLSHNMARDDPANPLNWPLHRKIYTSAAGWMAAYAV